MGRSMTSNRPYLFRAIYDWIVDNGLTPHILVNAEADGAMVPEGYVEDGRIILNVSPRAVSDWHQDMESLAFSARFNGATRRVSVPMPALLAIYARENGQGMAFGKDDGTSPPPPSTTPSEPAQRGRPQLH